MSTVHDRVMAALESTVGRRLDEVEDWQHQQRIARAVLDALRMRTEWAMACLDMEGQPDHGVHPMPEVDARAEVAATLRSAVYVREVTEWRAES